MADQRTDTLARLTSGDLPLVDLPFEVILHPSLADLHVADVLEALGATPPAISHAVGTMQGEPATRLGWVLDPDHPERWQTVVRSASRIGQPRRPLPHLHLLGPQTR